MKPIADSRTVALAGWPWLLPRLAFVLFVAALGALLWFSQRAEKDEQRANLISDVLWLEQNLYFQLTHSEEYLGQIGSPGLMPRIACSRHIPGREMPPRPVRARGPHRWKPRASQGRWAGASIAPPIR